MVTGLNKSKAIVLTGGNDRFWVYALVVTLGHNLWMSFRETLPDFSLSLAPAESDYIKDRIASVFVYADFRIVKFLKTDKIHLVSLCLG